MNRTTTMLCCLVAATLFFVSTTHANPKHVEGVNQLKSSVSNSVDVRVDQASGKATFVRVTKQGSLARQGRSVREKAELFLRGHGAAFGVADMQKELAPARVIRDATGAQHLVYDQKYEGLPVFGGQLRANFDANGELIAVNGNFLEELKVNTKPSIDSKLAEQIAIRQIFRQQQRQKRASLSVADALPVGADEREMQSLSIASNELMIFRTGLVQGINGNNHLAYQVEVVNDDISIREFLYVDAHNGELLDQITGIHEALDRRAFDAMGATAPGDNYPDTPFWVEGDPLPTTSIEADNMIIASEETYGMYFNAFTKDSFDGAGATMDAIFNRGDRCPNASWNGTFISFCPGMTTDDVTAHEWAHAYTDYTNDLIYQWQSGALNESYSDIWGEIVDIINGRGVDSPGGARTDGSCSDFGPGDDGDNSYRWLMGEESVIGVLRDMWNPNCAGDPGKVTDTVYWCSTGDSGGVHINSGVPNHAFALMADGGNYNGRAISAIGLLKAAHVHWNAQNMLTPSSNFLDQADALETACTGLIGADLTDFDGNASGEIISAADCAQVEEAVAAVELRTLPTQCNFTTLLDPAAPALCDGLGAVNTIAHEDFESGALPAGWTATAHDVVNPDTFDNPGWNVVGNLPGGATGGFGAFAPDLNVGDCSADVEAGAVALDSPVTTLPAGEHPRMAFDHWVATETGWDGGNIKLSVNGGDWTVIPASSYDFNPYNGAINGGTNDNPLNGEAAFTGSDGGSVGGSWGQSQVNLFGLAFPGDSVQLRFDLGVDGCSGLFGWYLDSVHTYSCQDEPLPICGDGVVDIGEVCDDGNMQDGDGCSSSCAVEEGWSCFDPIPPLPGTNIVADWSFESGDPAGDWTATSTVNPFTGFPLCASENDCPAAGLTSTGSWMVWIGGVGTGVTSNVEQSVTIPNSATELSIEARRGLCDDPSDTIHISLDGTDIGTVACDAVDGGYVTHSFPLAGFNDGGEHMLNIGGTVGGTNGTHSNFFVDDVVIGDNIPIPGEPSFCVAVTNDLACNQLVDFADGPPMDIWTTVDNTGSGLEWTNVAGSDESGNFTGGDGDAASVSSDRFGPAEFDTELISNSFSLVNASSATLNYLVNYQNFARLDFLDVDISIDAGTTWANLLSWNEDHGVFKGAPGEAVAIDLEDYIGESDVKLRWRYYDPNDFDWDWYAQVDNVGLRCNLIPDCGSAVAKPDRIWPPNFRFRKIDIEVEDPDGDEVSITIDSIFQDEPVGWLSPDGLGVGTDTARVRAERRWFHRNGRVYYISFTADDNNGGVCSGTVEVGVPKSPHRAAIGEGPRYDSTKRKRRWHWPRW